MAMTIVTTLVEGRHFIGVAALTNSLVASGFKGSFVVGHRGKPPRWFATQAEALSGDFSIDLRVVPETLTGHFTNLKPHWMAHLAESNPDAARITYADPDVCLVAQWECIDAWAGEGVGVCENPSPPLRRGSWKWRAWSRLAREHGIELRDDEPAYVNGGFVSVGRQSLGFVQRWKVLVEIVAERVGGLGVSPLPGGATPTHGLSRFDPFFFQDQDALNIAIRSGDEEIGVLSQDGMGFVPGVAFMTHALGAPKPWDRRFLHDAVLHSRKPSYADKVFMANCSGPIAPFGRLEYARKRLAIKAACAIRGRGWD